MTTFKDNATVDEQCENVYVQAASLFEKNTTLSLSNNYHFGIVSLATQLLGMDDSDLEDIARTISIYTSGYLLTEKDFGTGVNGDLLYIGPLEVAIDFIKGPNKSEVAISRTSSGGYRVELDGGNVFGVADTEELAWRYALAAEFGPIDEEFRPFMVHR